MSRESVLEQTLRTIRGKTPIKETTIFVRISMESDGRDVDSPIPDAHIVAALNTSLAGVTVWLARREGGYRVPYVITHMAVATPDH